MTIAERFRRHVRPDTSGRLTRGTPCQLWTGATVKGKYGKIQTGGRGSRIVLAHRLAWLLAFGPLRDSLDVHHVCEVTLCVNAGHLETVPHDQHGALRGFPYFGPGRPLDLGMLEPRA